MCTVTLVPLAEGRGQTGRRIEPPDFAALRVRLACNRDELRTRAAALPPALRVCGARRALMPIDPLSGGTWIAANDAGLAATLLNVYDGVSVRPGSDAAHAERPGEHRSRGTLIPPLMALDSFEVAQQACAAIPPRCYMPFRLILFDLQRVAEFVSDGTTLIGSCMPRGDRPLLFTSSGLGDAVVTGPRRALFEQFFSSADDWPAQQDAFHRHSWPERRHLSVCMERREARTVSQTLVEIDARQVRMTYVPDAPDRAEALASLTLIRGSV